MISDDRSCGGNQEELNYVLSKSEKYFLCPCKHAFNVLTLTKKLTHKMWVMWQGINVSYYSGQQVSFLVFT